jgi:hypothetical protein
MIRVERSEYRLDERVPDPKWGLLPTFYVPAVGIPGESDRHPLICPSDAIDDAITQRDGEARELPDHGEHYRGGANGSSGSDSRSILKMWKVKLKGTGQPLRHSNCQRHPHQVRRRRPRMAHRPVSGRTIARSLVIANRESFSQPFRRRGGKNHYHA